ncbi:hypothetical protein KUTeg_002561 [Tegillarca granosa]|uniref:alpha-1,6-mannosyl-glycoprotein 6-beta-N-acetylglucosaminyltransferase n=1 Tax=Tegillarca granosa TaxID=220873 RepID=A0ABQ9FUN0_TEGGR|nr:hypothetical protein KUTeg_002561 [Tegillarca granosa]
MIECEDRRKNCRTKANTTTDLKGLMCILVDLNEREAYTWIRRRIRRLWSGWIKAIFSLEKKQDLTRRVRKKILLYLGFAANKTGWNFVEGQLKGMGGLSRKKCRLSLEINTEIYINILIKSPEVNAPCQNLHQLPIDILYIDIVGLKQFKEFVKDGYPKFRLFLSIQCLVRVLDSFGTEPEFNSAMYSNVRKLVSPWTGLDLDTQQFFTFFPHSPDNSFMGFVAEQRQQLGQPIEKKDIALVYGKRPEFFQNRRPYLELISKFFEIHTTVPYGGPFIPSFVKNHGLLSGHELHKLLRAAKVFVGLGFPYEGPAPLEAIAEGAIFINPKYDPPRNRDNVGALHDKPTRRGLTSQHPYAEQFIGEPYVYTVNIYSFNDIVEALKKIKQITQFKPYIPYEYTEEGMLQRVNAYVENQNFCLFQRQPSKWPPAETVTFILGQNGMSCKDVCSLKDLICERSYFREINSIDAFKHHNVSCSGDYGIPDILVPAYDVFTSNCVLQNDELLYSCVGGHLNFRRLCPCRTYIKGQSALCKGCDK